MQPSSLSISITLTHTKFSVCIINNRIWESFIKNKEFLFLFFFTGKLFGTYTAYIAIWHLFGTDPAKL